MKPKNVSNDELAMMVQKGFAGMDEQFKRVDERIGDVEQRMDERFARVDEQFTQAHQELRAIRKELEGVVYRPEFEALQDQVRDMQHALNALKKKPA